MERNDELSAELLKAVNAQLATLEPSDAAATERDRIKAVVRQLAHRVFVRSPAVIQSISQFVFAQRIITFCALTVRAGRQGRLILALSSQWTVYMH